MKLHKRYDQTIRADIEIRVAVTDAVEKHDLTFAELIAILSDIIASWTKSEIREQRQPFRLCKDK